MAPTSANGQSRAGSTPSSATTGAATSSAATQPTAATTRAPISGSGRRRSPARTATARAPKRTPARVASRTTSTAAAGTRGATSVPAARSRSLDAHPGAARDALEVAESVLERDDVCVLRLDVEEVRLVRRLRPVADALARNECREAVLKEVDGCGPHTAARRR